MIHSELRVAVLGYLPRMVKIPSRCITVVPEYSFWLQAQG
jgi:hypothetical protein